MVNVTVREFAPVGELRAMAWPDGSRWTGTCDKLASERAQPTDFRWPGPPRYVFWTDLRGVEEDADRVHPPVGAGVWPVDVGFVMVVEQRSARRGRRS